jgi:hypothetical protein
LKTAGSSETVAAVSTPLSPEPKAPRLVTELVCLECGSHAKDAARGWVAYLLEGDVYVYCPACAEREFGD